MGSKKIFVDSGGFLALLDDNVLLRNKVVDILNQSRQTGVQLVTTDSVIGEVLTLLRCREKIPTKLVLDFIQGALFAEIELVGISRALFGEALAMMQKYADQYFSFTDCVSFKVMKDMKIKDVITIDKHFTIAGFNVLI